MMLLQDYTEEIKKLINEGKTESELLFYARSVSNEYHQQLVHIISDEFDYWKLTHNVHRPTLAELLLTIPLEQHIYIETPDEKVVYSGTHKNLGFEIRKQYCAKLVIAQTYIEKALTIYIEE